MIAIRQMHAAQSTVDELDDLTTVLQRIEARLYAAELREAARQLAHARGAVQSVRNGLDREARATYTAMRQGKVVPK